MARIMDKYYTPDIEEFYVGFEFESTYVLFNGTERVSEWKKITLDDDQFGWFYSAYTNDAVDSEFRVKYLDREDIESLGFTLDKTSTETQWKFFKGNLCLYYRPETKELGTFTVDPNKNSFMNKYARDNKAISFLVIKNKSELKKLLKQLNILQ